MDHCRARVVRTQFSARGCRAQRAGRVAYAAARCRYKAQPLSPPPSKPLGSRSGGNAMPGPAHGIKSSLGRPEPPAGCVSLVRESACRRLSSSTAGRRPGFIGCALRLYQERHGRERQASPGPEKMEVGGVVRDAGSGRSLAPDRADRLPLASYRFARSSRRRRVNGSARSAMARTRCARPW